MSVSVGAVERAAGKVLRATQTSTPNQSVYFGLVGYVDDPRVKSVNVRREMRK